MLRFFMFDTLTTDLLHFCVAKKVTNNNQTNIISVKVEHKGKRSTACWRQQRVGCQTQKGKKYVGITKRARRC